MSSNIRSRVITQGIERTPNRSMLRATGFQDADFGKPIVGVANGYSTVVAQNDAAIRDVEDIRREIVARLTLFMQNKDRATS